MDANPIITPANDRDSTRPYLDGIPRKFGIDHIVEVVDAHFLVDGAWQTMQTRLIDRGYRKKKTLGENENLSLVSHSCKRPIPNALRIIRCVDAVIRKNSDRHAEGCRYLRAGIPARAPTALHLQEELNHNQLPGREPVAYLLCAS